MLLNDKDVMGTAVDIANVVGDLRNNSNPFEKVAKPKAFEEDAEAPLCIANTLPYPKCIYMPLRVVHCTAAHQKGELKFDAEDCGLPITIGEVFHSCHLCNSYDLCHDCHLERYQEATGKTSEIEQ